MSIALDLMIPVIMIITAIIGYRQGFVRYAIRLAGTVGCIIIALVLSGILAAPIYVSVVAPRIESALNKQLENFDIAGLFRDRLPNENALVNMDDKQIRKALSDSGSIPAAFERVAKESGCSDKDAADIRASVDDFFRVDFCTRFAEASGYEDYEEFAGQLDISVAKAYDLVRAFASGEDSSEGVKYLVDNVINGTITGLIRFMLFAIIFVICSMIIAVVFTVAGVLDHLPMVSGINKTGGLILGMLKGVLYVFLIALLYAAVVKTGLLVSTEDVDETIIFKYFFSVFYK